MFFNWIIRFSFFLGYNFNWRYVLQLDGGYRILRSLDLKERLASKSNFFPENLCSPTPSGHQLNNDCLAALVYYDCTYTNGHVKHQPVMCLTMCLYYFM